jgi:hypothetical protein
MPDFERYRRHLLRATMFLAGHRDARRIDGLVVAMESASRQLEVGRRGSWTLRPDPQWTFPLDWRHVRPAARAELEVGADIQVRGGQLVQHSVTFAVVTSGHDPARGSGDSCCLATVGDAPRVVRRAHFDVDLGSGRSNRPTTHLQLGGRPGPRSTSGPHYCLDQYLDLPRIPMPPMDPVLALDFLLAQFGCSEVETLLRESMWAGLVHKSESLWSAPYFRASHRFLSAPPRGRTHYAFQCDANWLS